MTSWQDIQAEIEKGKGPGKEGGDFDSVRRAKYALVKQLTGRLYIPVNPASDSVSKRPMIGAKRRWMVIILLCGRNESRGSGVSAWIPRTVPAGKRCG